MVGGANVDISARYETKTANHIDSYPGSISTSAGGVARNIAENLARLGTPVRLITGLGNDFYSSIIRASLTLPLINITASRSLPNMPSDTYLSLHDKSGELVCAVNQMALVDSITPDYLSRFERTIARSLFLAADCNLPEESIGWLTELKNRAPIFIDTVSVHKATRLAPYLNRCDGLKCNRMEATTLLGLSHNATAYELTERLCDAGVGTVILSLGKDGVFLRNKDGLRQLQQNLVPRTISSTNGAGDALLAGFIHGIVCDMGTEKAIQLGLKAAEMALGAASAVHPNVGDVIKSKVIIPCEKS